MKKGVFALALVIVLIFSACGQTVAEPVFSYLGGEIKTAQIFEEDWTLVFVYIEFTNSSSETVLPADCVDVKAYQNGTEIPIIVFTGEQWGYYIQCDTGVQAGTTAKVVWTFQPVDDSAVVVEFSDGQRFNIDSKE